MQDTRKHQRSRVKLQEFCRDFKFAYCLRRSERHNFIVVFDWNVVIEFFLPQDMNFCQRHPACPSICWIIVICLACYFDTSRRKFFFKTKRSTLKKEMKNPMFWSVMYLRQRVKVSISAPEITTSFPPPTLPAVSHEWAVSKRLDVTLKSNIDVILCLDCSSNFF